MLGFGVAVGDEVALEAKVDVSIEDASEVLDVSDHEIEVGTLFKNAGSGRGVPDIFAGDSKISQTL